MGSVSAWEGIFMLVVLKIPVVYLAIVVWWAIRAEPAADESGGDPAAVLAPLSPCGWEDWRRRRALRAASRRPLGRGPRGAAARRLGVST